MNELIIVRHGETAGGSSTRLYGGTDIELGDIGREQMRRAGAALEDVRFQAIYTSPLRRARESTEIVMGARDCEIQIVAGFREINFGAWEGLTLDEVAQRDPENHAEWKKGLMSFQFPDGDLKSAFFAGAGRAAIETFSAAPLPALAVLHKGVIKGVFSHLLNKPVEEVIDWHVELGSIHRFARDAGGAWSLLSSNETAHLGNSRIPGSR